MEQSDILLFLSRSYQRGWIDEYTNIPIHMKQDIAGKQQAKDLFPQKKNEMEWN